MRMSGTSDTRLPTRMNDGKMNELEESYFDIFQQEFYLHCYSLLSNERNSFQESKEGFTYAPQALEEKVSPKVLMFLNAAELSSWSVKIRRACKKIKIDDMDDFDTDYIDMDQLLIMYLEEFKNLKRNTNKKIQK